MPRILHIINGDSFAGAECQMLNTVVGLKKYSVYDVGVLLFHDAVLARRLRERGIETKVVRCRFPALIKSIRLIKNMLLNEKIDLIHTHGYKANVIAHLASLGLTGLKKVRTEHGLPEPFKGIRQLKYSLYISVDGMIAASSTDKIVAVSKDVYEKCLTRVLSDKVVYIESGIDAPNARPENGRDSFRHRFSIGANKRLVGIIARLMPVKNHRMFVDLIVELSKQDDDIKGVIVGEGPLEGDLRKYISERNIDSKVIFTGFVDDVASVLQSLDILVFTSFHEGLPLALLEAMNQGTPVAAVAVGGLKDALADCCSEGLVNSHDPVEMARVCLAILNDPAMRNKMICAAKAKVKKHYSMETYIVKLSGVYDELLSSRATSPEDGRER